MWLSKHICASIANASNLILYIIPLDIASSFRNLKLSNFHFQLVSNNCFIAPVSPFIFLCINWAIIEKCIKVEYCSPITKVSIYKVLGPQNHKNRLNHIVTFISIYSGCHIVISSPSSLVYWGALHRWHYRRERIRQLVSVRSFYEPLL